MTLCMQLSLTFDMPRNSLLSVGKPIHFGYLPKTVVGIAWRPGSVFGQQRGLLSGFGIARGSAIDRIIDDVEHEHHYPGKRQHDKRPGHIFATPSASPPTRALIRERTLPTFHRNPLP